MVMRTTLGARGKKDQAKYKANESTSRIELLTGVKKIIHKNTICSGAQYEPNKF